MITIVAILMLFAMVLLLNVIGPILLIPIGLVLLDITVFKRIFGRHEKSFDERFRR